LGQPGSVTWFNLCVALKDILWMSSPLTWNIPPTKQYILDQTQYHPLDKGIVSTLYPLYSFTSPGTRLRIESLINLNYWQVATCSFSSLHPSPISNLPATVTSLGPSQALVIWAQNWSKARESSRHTCLALRSNTTYCWHWSKRRFFKVQKCRTRFSLCKSSLKMAVEQSTERLWAKLHHPDNCQAFPQDESSEEEREQKVCPRRKQDRGDQGESLLLRVPSIRKEERAISDS
jgi:hypothetical protein